MARNYKKKGDNPNMGRPKKEIDQTRFEDMYIAGCTEAFICRRLGVGVETLRNWFRPLYGVSTFSEIRGIVDSEDWLHCDTRVNILNHARRDPKTAMYLADRLNVFPASSAVPNDINEEADDFSKAIAAELAEIIEQRKELAEELTDDED